MFFEGASGSEKKTLGCIVCSNDGVSLNKLTHKRKNGCRNPSETCTYWIGLINVISDAHEPAYLSNRGLGDSCDDDCYKECYCSESSEMRGIRHV